jgi:hypothetical protein
MAYADNIQGSLSIRIRCIHLLNRFQSNRPQYAFILVLYGCIALSLVLTLTLNDAKTRP